MRRNRNKKKTRQHLSSGIYTYVVCRARPQNQSAECYTAHVQIQKSLKYNLYTYRQRLLQRADNTVRVYNNNILYDKNGEQK